MDRLRQIEMVVRAADAGSFAKAAVTLGVTPSAVSHAVAELEKARRTTLFYRTTRQLTLTEDGEAFCRGGREVLDKLVEMEAASHPGVARLSGRIRIGIGTVITQYLVMPRLAEFLRRHPALSVECRQQRQVKDMNAEGMDVMTWVGHQPDPGVIAHKLCDMRFGVYGAPTYLKTHGIPAHPRDLARHRCVVFHPGSWSPRPLDTWEFQRGAAREAVTVKSTLLCDEREMLLTAAVNGVGLIRSGFFDPALIATGQLRRVLENWTCLGSPSLYLMYRKSQRQSPKVSAFLEFMKESMAAFDPEELTVVHPPAARPVSSILRKSQP